MSEQIDWSKAPESAMVLLKHTRDGAYAVAESFSDDARTWHWPDPRYSFHLMPAMWYVVSRRPATPSWTGEGMPPVGVVCEANFVGSWTEFEMRYYGESYVIFKTRYEVQRTRIDFDTCGVKFRPIRTPEQIAADEREAAIDQMVADTQAAHGWTEAFGMLHDKGYRKP